jgi:hypothetical protein
MSDMIVTWPKTKPLDTYLEECREAEKRCLAINFRVPRLPNPRRLGNATRVYVIHDGAIRGWHRLLSAQHRAENDVVDQVAGDHWPEGNYLVRDAHWHPLPQPVPWAGFRGFRYL